MSIGDDQEANTLAQSQTLSLVSAIEIDGTKAQISTSDMQSKHHRYEGEDDPESGVLSAIIEEIALEQSEQTSAELITTPTQDIASERPAEIKVTVDSQSGASQSKVYADCLGKTEFAQTGSPTARAMLHNQARKVLPASSMFCGCLITISAVEVA